LNLMDTPSMFKRQAGLLLRFYQNKVIGVDNEKDRTFNITNIEIECPFIFNSSKMQLYHLYIRIYIIR
jgi:hypothetical protein